MTDDILLIDTQDPARLAAAGFEHVDVRTNEFGWAAFAQDL